MTPYLKDRLPIWEVAADHIISKKGDTTLAYAVTKPEIFTLSGDQLREIHSSWTKALETLPPNTIVHIQDWYWQTEWKGDFDRSGDDLLSAGSERYHHERPVLEHRCYLFITRWPQRRSWGGGTALTRNYLTPQDTLSPKAIQEFDARVGQFIHILADSGLIECTRMSTEELTGSETQTGLIEQYCQLNMPGEIPQTRDLHFGKGLRIGRNHCLLHTLADAEFLPALFSPGMDYTPYSNERLPFPIGFASRVGLLLSCNHIYNQFIIIEDQVKVRRELEAKSRRMQSLSAHSRENTLNKKDIDELLDVSIACGRQMVRAHFNVFSWTGDEKEVDRLNDKVAAAISKLGATPYLETEVAPHIWGAGIPGNAADMLLEETFHTLADEAACMLIPDTNYRDSLSFTGLRLGCRLQGRPLQVDLSDTPMQTGLITNRNKFVLGGSGSGKSFFTNHMMRSYYDQGAHIVIVDIGNSYKGLCNLTRGYYFTYTDATPLRLNPFWLPPGETPDTEKKESLKTLLLALWKKEDEAFIRSEYVALSNALHMYYERLAVQPEIFPCFDSFYEFFRDDFTAILSGDKVQRKDFDIDNFLYVLRPFYRGGEFDFLLNAREQLDLLQQRLIVFELDTVKDHPILFPVVTIVIMEVFIGKMRNLPGVRKVILIEEAWKAIARQGMSEYLKYLFKTVRKFYGEAIVVTQEVEDIISSPVVKQAILNNADCKILLDQSKFRNKFDDLQQLLGLTDQDKAQVLSLNQHKDPQRKYKEVFISLGTSCSKVYRTEVSVEEYLTYTTEQREKLLVEEWTQKHNSLKQGIKTLAAAIRNGSVKLLLTGAMALLFLLAPTQKASAQFAIADIIQMAVKKVIVATDLAIQRIQTETIGLQNAQKVLENAMQLDRLTDIADWLRRQKELFAGYYQELWEVKNALMLYHRVKDITEQQVQLMAGCKKALSQLRKDPHFSLDELEHMGRVYGAIVDGSVRTAAQLTKVVTGFVTQMQDGDRLEIIDRLGEEMEQQRRDLLAFSQDNILLSLQRSKSQAEINFIQKLYNIH